MLVDWSEVAESDLDALVWYLADEDMAGALELDARVRMQARMLADFPQMGRPGRFVDTRELIIPEDRCVILYQLAYGKVNILRLIHGGQKWPDKV